MQSGRQALKELYRVHFPTSAGIEVTGAAIEEAVKHREHTLGAFLGKLLRKFMIALYLT